MDYTKPGMSEETRRALEELTSEQAFLKRVMKGAKKATTSPRQLLSGAKKWRTYYGAETSPRFKIWTFVDPSRAAKKLKELQDFGVPADKIEIVSECPHDGRRVLTPQRGDEGEEWVEECGCVYGSWTCSETFEVRVTATQYEMLRRCPTCEGGAWQLYPKARLDVHGDVVVDHHPRCEHSTELLETALARLEDVEDANAA